MSDRAPVSIVAPGIFKALEELCRLSVQYTDNHEIVRRSVAQVLLQMRLEARREFGHETADCIKLAKFLRDSNPDVEQKDRRRAQRTGDPLAHLVKTDGITPEQYEAALLIRSVWSAFSKGLSYRQRKYKKHDETIPAPGRPRQPVELMSTGLFEAWHDVYSPWYKGAQLRSVADRTKDHRRYMTHAGLVLRVVVEMIHPRHLDTNLSLRHGTVLRILRMELDALTGIVPIPRSKTNEEAGTKDDEGSKAAGSRSAKGKNGASEKGRGEGTARGKEARAQG